MPVFLLIRAICVFVDSSELLNVFFIEQQSSSSRAVAAAAAMIIQKKRLSIHMYIDEFASRCEKFDNFVSFVFLFLCVWCFVWLSVDVIFCLFFVWLSVGVCFCFASA